MTTLAPVRGEASVLESYVSSLEQLQSATGEADQLELLATLKEDFLHRTGLVRTPGREAEAVMYMGPLLQMCTAKSAKVRKWVASFIADLAGLAPWWACSVDVLPILLILLDDTQSKVAKMAVTTATKIYTRALGLLAKDELSSAEAHAVGLINTEVWANILELVSPIVKLGASAGKDGLRIVALKFYEACATANHALPLSAGAAGTTAAGGAASRIPEFVDVYVMRRKGMSLIEALAQVTKSSTVSATVIKVVIGLLLKVGRELPATLSLVMDTLLALANNIPKSVARAQIKPTRFMIKSALLQFLRLPATEEYHEKIMTALGNSLNAHDQAESAIRVAERSMGRLSGYRKRQRDAAELAQKEARKRAKSEALAAELSKSLEKLATVDPQTVDVISKCVQESAGDPTVLLSLLAEKGVNIASISDKLGAMVSSAAKKKGSGVRDMDVVSSSSSLDILASDPRRAIKALPWSERLAKASAKATPAASLTLSQCLTLYDASLERIVASSRDIASGGGSSVLLNLIPHLGMLRLLVVSQDDNLATAEATAAAEASLLAFLVSNLPETRPSLVGWLHLAYANTQGLLPAMDAMDISVYNALLERVVVALAEPAQGADAPSPDAVGHLASILCDVPVIPDAVLDTVRGRMNAALAADASDGSSEAEASGAGMGGGDEEADEASADGALTSASLKLWCELALKRPNTGSVFAQEVLSAAVSPSVELRARAIPMVLANLFPIAHDQVVAFAMDTASELTSWSADDDPDASAGPEAIDARTKELQRHVGLLFAVAEVAPDLLTKFVGLYTELTMFAKRTILREIQGLVLALGSSAPVILQLVESHPDDAKILVLKMLHVLTDAAPPSKDLVAAVLRLHAARHEAEVLIPILAGLPRVTLLEHIGDLLSLPERKARYAVKCLTASGMSISVVDFLVHVHALDPSETLPLTRLRSVVAWVFADDAAATEKMQAILIPRLVGLTKIPPLFMSTIKAVWETRPALSMFIIQQLSQMITSSRSSKKKIWKNSQLWSEFVEFVINARPQSLSLALQLPPKPFAAVLKKSADLVSEMVAYVKTQRGRVPRSHVEALKERVKKNKLKRKAAERAAAAAAAAAPAAPAAPAADS